MIVFPVVLPVMIRMMYNYFCSCRHVFRLLKLERASQERNVCKLLFIANNNLCQLQQKVRTTQITPFVEERGKFSDFR